MSLRALNRQFFTLGGFICLSWAISDSIDSKAGLSCITQEIKMPLFPCMLIPPEKYFLNGTGRKKEKG